MTIASMTKFLRRYWCWIVFVLIVMVGMYLRFWRIESTGGYGWDQARDAWKVRDVLMGQFVLNGPRTGVGHFHLGPLWYYIEAPFYFISNYDPIGAQYANILVNLFNFIALFWVTRRVFGNGTALFTTGIYTMSRYLVEINRTPWNVSPIPGVAVLIFYGIYQVVFYKKYRWIPMVAFLTGLFSHLHFAVVFLPPIIALSFLAAKDKKKVFLYSLLSLPLFLIWLIPIALFDLQSKGADSNLFQSFLHDYWVGIHLQFFLHRLNDAFVQFQTVLLLGGDYPLLKFILPVLFVVFLLFEHDAKKRILGYLIVLWFLVPLLVYGVYGGSTSEYYVLFNIPMVLWITAYVQGRLLKGVGSFRVIVIVFLVALWGWNIYLQTKGQWIKPAYGGLVQQKDEVRQKIRKGEKMEYNEGIIQTYLYQIWALDKKSSH
ncbi:hypothetical protein HGB07_05100 [Candidatus Roizmanbacteria bacterium]|nr:hypothetical protein [Candidatus Roizmanbacteria bacterium]